MLVMWSAHGADPGGSFAGQNDAKIGGGKRAIVKPPEHSTALAASGRYAILRNQIEVDLGNPPSGLAFHAEFGLLTASPASVTDLYSRDLMSFTVPSVVAPNGDWLVMSPAGDKYGTAANKQKVNRIMLLRSSDKGRSWGQPEVAWDPPIGNVGVGLLRSQKTVHLYAFGTERGSDHVSHSDVHDHPVGYRASADNGHSWSEVRLIRPVNDRDFNGTSSMLR